MCSLKIQNICLLLGGISLLLIIKFSENLFNLVSLTMYDTELLQNKNVSKQKKYQENSSTERLRHSYISRCHNNSATCYHGDLNTSDPLTVPAPIPFWENYSNPCFYDSSGKARCFPAVFCLSPQKSGTTDLFQKLKKHPHIFNGIQKEPQFWDRGIYHYYTHWNRPYTVSSYLQRFDRVVDQIQNVTSSNMYHPAVALDFSATYLYDQLLWKRLPHNNGSNEPIIGPAEMVKHILPKTKFIVMLRNPINRLYSDWCFFKKKGPEEFHTAVLRGISYFNTCVNSNKLPFRACLFNNPVESIITEQWMPEASWQPVVRLRIGLYADLLNEWLNQFPRDQFYFETLENYGRHRARVLNDIFGFLGLEKYKVVGPFKLIYNENRKYTPMFKKTYELLESFYRPYNIKLSQLLNSTKYLWNDTHRSYF